jgi:RpiR family carbohydrate utilization transcriptional regulator
MIVDVLATCLALRIGSEKLQPMLRDMKSNLRSKRYA